MLSANFVDCFWVFDNILWKWCLGIAVFKQSDTLFFDCTLSVSSKHWTAPRWTSNKCYQPTLSIAAAPDNIRFNSSAPQWTVYCSRTVCSQKIAISWGITLAKTANTKHATSNKCGQGHTSTNVVSWQRLLGVQRAKINVYCSRTLRSQKLSTT